MSKGYDDPYGNAVAEVNGVRIRNLAHLVEVVRDATGEFLEFTFQGHATFTIVFRRQEALDATEEILGDNGIRQQCSPDIAPIWKRRAHSSGRMSRLSQPKTRSPEVRRAQEREAVGLIGMLVRAPGHSRQSRGDIRHHRPTLPLQLVLPGHLDQPAA